MDEFPFTDKEWSRVRDAALAILNAGCADDMVLRASAFKELQSVLFDLRHKYGEHPTLLETEADFMDQPKKSVPLYERATRLAQKGSLLTYTIRLSLANVLLEEMKDPKGALRELLACREEIAAHADEYVQQEWQRLQAKCGPRGKSGR